MVLLSHARAMFLMCGVAGCNMIAGIEPPLDRDGSTLPQPSIDSGADAGTSPPPQTPPSDAGPQSPNFDASPLKPGPCPSTMPATNAPCPKPALECQYGD